MTERGRTIGAALLLILLATFVSEASLQRSLPSLGWPDEWIYLTGARNIAERGTLNTNFYIASSIEILGYPHRDVHLPGYALILAAVGSFRGFSHQSAAELNRFCHVVIVLSAFLLARRFFPPGRSFLAATLVAILPPYPGYLSIAYPEHVTAAAFIGLVTAAAWTRTPVTTFVLGVVAGAAMLFRETMLFALPIFAQQLGTRRLVRAFLPGFVLAAVTILPPLSANRAIHPNALYPSVITEAVKSPDPLGRLVATVVENARTNLELLFTSNPAAQAEDAVLLFLLGLFGLGALVRLRLESRARGFMDAVLVSSALLFAAMIILYVVRERGGVWGGVRALMPFAPLVVVALCGLHLGRPVSGILVTGVLSLSLFLNSWQIAFFNRYKGSNLEDQDRAATFIEERTKRFAPRRVVGGRYFQYGFRNFPTEVVWSGVNTMADLNRLYPKAPFDFVVIHRRSTMRFDLRKDPRYEWLNAAEGQAAEYQIYRRVAP